MDRTENDKRKAATALLRAVEASDPKNAPDFGTPQADNAPQNQTSGPNPARPPATPNQASTPAGGTPQTARPGYTARKFRPDALKIVAPPTTTPVADQRKTETTKPIAGPARMEKRHRGVLYSFILLVLLPIAATAFYLWGIARDQYASTVAFSIRREELSSSLDLLGGITSLGGGGGSDTDVLYDFIRSQKLVAQIDQKLDLNAIYSVYWPEDPVFAYDPSGTIEDLLRHWKRKVQITYDTGTGLITLRVLAFGPENATAIATDILEESTQMINALSQDARADATRYALAEVDIAVERLKQARGDLTKFRLKSQVVDPQADLQGQTGVLNNLQAQLAESLIELDLLRFSANDSDPRVRQAERRVEVIEKRIALERGKFGIGGQGPGGEDFATLVAEFERLTVDREFAEETYRAALVAYDAALAEAKRKSLYLAAHIQPTVAERPDFPRRWTLLALASFFLLMSWSMAVLIYYSIRDRR